MIYRCKNLPKEFQLLVAGTVYVNETMEKIDIVNAINEFQIQARPKIKQKRKAQ